MHDYVVLDVFTQSPMTGNQLAVFLDGTGLDDALMQRTARELNLSETVFLFPGDGGADASMRIFTPGAELAFAGHPVLGTAFVVAERLGAERIVLGTPAGAVPVELRRTGDEITYGEMTQPMPDVSPFDRPDELLAALGVRRSELPLECYRNGPNNVLVTLASEAEVTALRPDIGALTALGPLNVSCFAGADERYRTRMFAPGIGIVEDPATGSAAGPIALHLVRHGRLGFGVEIELSQGSEIGRPSVLRARIEGREGAVERIVVGGSAVLVARGSYRLEA
jgi:trans-2,3-dihydro-3-hydroxyanthranilate isomerase